MDSQQPKPSRPPSPASPAPSPADAPSPAPAEERLARQAAETVAQSEGREHGRRWLKFSALALIAMLALSYVGVLMSFRGDYAYPTIYMLDGISVGAGNPFLSSGIAAASSAKSDYCFYIPGMGLVGINENYQRSWALRPSQSSASQYKHLEVFDVRGHSMTAEVERFPAGSIDPLFAAARDGEWGTAAQAAERLHQRPPNRPTAIYWRIATLCRAERVEEARRIWEQSREIVEADPTYRSVLYPLYIENDLKAGEPGQEALRDEYEKLFGGASRHYLTPSTMDLSASLEWFLERKERDAPHIYSLSSNFFPSFIHYQVSTKVASQISGFLLMTGGRDQAKELLWGGWSVANVYYINIKLTGELIRITCRSIVLDALIDLFVHADIPAERLAEDWSELEDLINRPPLRTIQEAEDFFEIMRRADDGFRLTSSSSSSMTNSLNRWKSMEAKRRLFRQAVRVRHYRSARGEWPPIGSDGAPENLELELQAPALDPFTNPEAPLRAAIIGDQFVLYSVGPDGVDDGGAVVYDPNRSRHPVGDIVIALDETPRYRFPLEPNYIYQGMEDFNARYPHGAPTDLFISPPSPLGVIDEASGIRVWTSGPDGDIGRGATRPASLPDGGVYYDPTNGATSDGDLWILLPKE